MVLDEIPFELGKKSALKSLIAGRRGLVVTTLELRSDGVGGFEGQVEERVWIGHICRGL